MKLRRTLVLGVLALSGLGNRASAQYYPPNGYYPPPQQMGVPVNPYGQGFVPQPGYSRPPGYPQPAYAPGMPMPPNPIMVNRGQPALARPVAASPVTVPPSPPKADANAAWKKVQAEPTLAAPQPVAPSENEPPTTDSAPPPLPSETS